VSTLFQELYYTIGQLGKCKKQKPISVQNKDIDQGTFVSEINVVYPYYVTLLKEQKFFDGVLLYRFHKCLSRKNSKNCVNCVNVYPVNFPVNFLFLCKWSINQP
jgi:hypothetical protein